MGIVLQLMFINTASLNMLIPSYSVIIEEYGISDSLMYWPDSIAVLVTAFVMIIWGYFTDKVDRNKVIHGGAILSTVGFIFTAFSSSFPQLLIARIITGAGMGFAIPVGYSILSDIILPEERSGLFGFLTIFSSISNGTGQGLSAFLGPLNILSFEWQFPFLILAILALLAVIQLIFVRLPDKGSTEESLADLWEYEEMEYNYTISQHQLIKILKKPTNKYLIFNGFFAIVPGTLIIFSLITTFSHPTLGFFATLPPEIRTQVSTIMAGMTSFGYLVGSIVLARGGDIIFKKNPRNRAILAFICNILAIPLCLFMFLQMKPIEATLLPIYPEEIPAEEILSYVITTLQFIFQNKPSYWFYLIFAFLGTFFSAGMVTNKKAVMVDVNLPEHRGTATSFFQLTEQIGKSVTLMLAAGILQWLGSYLSMLYFGLIFWIPSAVLWFFAIKFVGRDINQKETLLRERAQMTFIDYFFELEIAIDSGIQKVQDAKDLIFVDPAKAVDIIEKAILKFNLITIKAHNKGMNDHEERSHELLKNAIEFHEKLIVFLKESKNQSAEESQASLKSLYDFIDAKWEESDFGNIETLYESGYLKVCEARLQRSYNPFQTQTILQKAIDIYERVIRLTQDRILDPDERKLSESEYEMQERIHRLLINAQKSKSNTEILKRKLKEIITTLTDRDVPEMELNTILDISNQYGVKLKEIVADSFNRRIYRKISRSLNEINEIFEEYDKWQARE